MMSARGNEPSFVGDMAFVSPTIQTNTNSATWELRNFSFLCAATEGKTYDCAPCLSVGPFVFKISLEFKLPYRGMKGKGKGFGKKTEIMKSMLVFNIRRVDKEPGEAITDVSFGLLSPTWYCNSRRFVNTRPVGATHWQYYGAAAAARPSQMSGVYPLGVGESKSAPLVSIPDLFLQGRYLENDTLRLQCTVTAGPSQPRLILSLSGEDEMSVLKEMGLHFLRLFETETLCDVELEVGDERLKAHSVVLAARSPVFAAMWSSCMKEGLHKTVKIEGLDVAAVRNILRFMYSGQLEQGLGGDESMLRTLEGADRYQIQSLVNLCERSLAANMSLDNVIPLLQAADLAGIPGLRKRCIDFIVSSSTVLAEVKQQESFANLTLRNPQLTVDIMEAMAAVFTKTASVTNDPYVEAWGAFDAPSGS